MLTIGDNDNWVCCAPGSNVVLSLSGNARKCPSASLLSKGIWSLVGSPVNFFPQPLYGGQTIRVAVGLRFGASLFSPHTGCHCGSEVDTLATHVLSCRQSQGRHHAAMNNIIPCSLVSANVPSRLKPSGLERADSKHPDGVTVVPWRRGKHLVWDTTSLDTFAPSYLQSATSAAGAVAALVENRKKGKYGGLDSTYTFIPIAIESSGACGPLTMGFLRDLGNHLKLTTGENSFKYLLHKLSVAVQRGNSPGNNRPSLQRLHRT